MREGTICSLSSGTMILLLGTLPIINLIGGYQASGLLGRRAMNFLGGDCVIL